MKPGSKYYHLALGIRKLKPGEAYVAGRSEFSCKPESFQSMLYTLASEKGGGWRATSVVVGKVVVYAFYKNTDYMRPNLKAYPIVQKMRGER